MGPCVLRTDRDRLGRRRPGRIEVALGRGDLRHLEMAVRESRALPEHVVAESAGLRVFLLLHELVEPLVLPEECDQVLGVLLAPVEALRRGVAAPAQVAESGQALAGL